MKAVVKLGGALLETEASRASIARGIARASGAGVRLTAVHGGGKQLTKALLDRGISSRFIDGLRATGTEAMETVVQVLAGSVNHSLVASLRAKGLKAVGLSGIDGELTTAEQLSRDLGAVGRIVSVDPALLDLLTSNGYVPAIACIAGDSQGGVYNVNADQMAAACAAAWRAEQLIFLTDVAGVIDSGGQVVPRLTREGASQLMSDGTAAGGMRAKLDAALSALESGVGSVIIAPGAQGDPLEALFRGSWLGTVLTR